MTLSLRSVLLAVLFGAIVLSFGPVGSAHETISLPPSWQPVNPDQNLPIGKTPWEEANEHLFSYPHFSDNPPPGPVSNPAEWEPMTGVLIRYGGSFGLPSSLIAEMSEDVEVKSIVSSTSQMNTVISQFQSWGVNLSNCTFLIAPSNSMWTRDYGPWYIFTGNGEQGITDHHYNRPTRPQDNMIPWVLGDTLNIPVYGMEVIHTGGNYMSDGMGVAMSTNLVYSENSNLTTQQVDDSIMYYTGNDYIVVPDILTSGIHHIDCWGKMLDPGRLIVKRLSPTNAILEANVAYFQSLVSSYGRPYECVRVDCYSSTPYTNSLILNNKVLVPLFGGALDQPAMQTYQTAMPGYEILGYTGSWVSDDAIHCRGMGMTDRYMLRITHVPVFDQINNTNGYQVKTWIHRYSNRPFINGTPVVMWKLQGQPTYNTLAMTSLPGDSFSAYIPHQNDNTVVQYYIHAEDDSGRVENHPYIGPGNPHNFNILQANPLTVDLAPQGLPIVIPPGGGSFSYTINITNNCSMPVQFDGWLGATLPSGSDYQTFLRYNVNLPVGGTVTRNMTQAIPGSAPVGNYTYWLKAGLKPQNTIWGQDSFPFSKSGLDGSDQTSGNWALYGWEESSTTAPVTPLGYYLSPNYPNPFNPLTSVAFSLPQAQPVKLSIYNAQGRLVAVIVDGYRAEGVHEVTWDASGLSSGVYFCRMQAGEFTSSSKMVLLK